MTRRARVVAAVEKHLARRPPGFYPANELHTNVVMAGCSLVCLVCGATGSTGVMPHEPGYGGAVEVFLRVHKGCRP